jgi:hypothetical protein
MYQIYAVAACLVLLQPVAVATKVPKWTVYEITLQAQGKYQQPYLATSVSATFKGPGGVTKEVQGFWLIFYS